MSKVIRDDLSERLIHLTRDFDGKSGKQRFIEILNSRTINGTNNDIRGGHNCICFSEAPISSIGQLLARKAQEIRYSPFGFMFSKDYLFDKGARPVIYQTEEEYKLLPKEMQYKHVKFNLNGANKTDWTWEREWRLQTDKFELEVPWTTVIVPTRSEMVDIIITHQAKLRQLSISAYGAGFMQIDWHFIILEDLGFDFSY